ncbi:hypothetical protein D0T87_24460, partial [Bacteroides sp. 51]|nr:hypothetical protein [Bacteroides sp. 51]
MNHWDLSGVDFAAKNLDDITAVRDGEISSSAAYFLIKRKQGSLSVFGADLIYHLLYFQNKF